MITALSRRNDFALLQRSGIIRRSGPLRARVIVVENPPPESIKLGFTIGRKFGPAVRRNRMRRRLRHCVAEAAAGSVEVDTSHLLLTASPEALVTSHTELVGHCRNVMVEAA
ncbi:MAG: hypothetical protein HKN24_12595 [Acidimicrobiales bacterium]|nr:hypothetical protein [Acidimicrobiales bacterium]